MWMQLHVVSLSSELERHNFFFTESQFLHFHASRSEATSYFFEARKICTRDDAGTGGMKNGNRTRIEHGEGMDRYPRNCMFLTKMQMRMHRAWEIVPGRIYEQNEQES